MYLYQLPVKLNRPASSLPLGVRDRNKGKPVVPPFVTTIPPVAQYVAAIYDNTGKYMGYGDWETTRKALYAMYYATGGNYKIKKDKWKWSNQPGFANVYDQDYIMVHDAIKACALVAIKRSFITKDLVDLDDNKAKALAAKKEYEHTMIGSSSEDGTSDTIYLRADGYGILDNKTLDRIDAQLKKDLEPYQERARQIRLQYLEAIKAIKQEKLDGPYAKARTMINKHFDDVAGASDTMNAAKDSSGLDLDI